MTLSFFFRNIYKAYYETESSFKLRRYLTMEDKSKELLLARAVLALNDRVTELEKSIRGYCNQSEKGS